MGKRIFDLIFSMIALLILLPAFILISILIKMNDRGPVFYRGVRVGRYGKLFRIYKFRTMIVNAEKVGGPSTPDDDPRITRVGKLLRKYKLDELPQIINVIKGEMSLVGPRPEVPKYVEMFTEEEKRILQVRPGITDWASLWNPDEGAILKNSKDPEKKYVEEIRPKKLKLQLYYVNNRSFFIDIKIIFLTILSVITKKRFVEDI
jgi:lipopolysaccharide/colanic/teichoic acid biosynthesis glycosyltransferase